MPTFDTLSAHRGRAHTLTSSPDRPGTGTPRRKLAEVTENALLLALLREPEGMSAAELSRITQLSQPTVKKGLERLHFDRDVEKISKRWFAIPKRNHVIGISVRSRAERRAAGGGFDFSWSVCGLVTDRAGLPTGIQIPTAEVEQRISDASDHVKWDYNTDYDYVCSRIVEMIRDLQGIAKSKSADVGAVGIQIGGHIDGRNDPDGRPTRGRIMFSPSLGWRNKPLGDDIFREVGIPTIVENDANAFALWESFDPSRPDRFAVVLLSESVGGAIVDRRRVLHGATGGAAEIGHLPIEGESSLCICGRSGCVATVAGYGAIRNAVIQKGLATHSLRELVAEADSGATLPREILDRAAKALSHSIVALCCAVEPTEIIIASQAFERSAYFKSQLRAHTADRMFESFDISLRFVDADQRHAAAGAAWSAVIRNPRQNAELS
jgi:predicted NBD/HSP70 family sugar kinase